jgi:hypothetical protein
VQYSNQNCFQGGFEHKGSIGERQLLPDQLCRTNTPYKKTFPLSEFSAACAISTYNRTYTLLDSSLFLARYSIAFLAHSLCFGYSRREIGRNSSLMTRITCLPSYAILLSNIKLSGVSPFRVL